MEGFTKFMRLVFVPLLTLTAATLVMSGKNVEPQYLQDGAAIIGRDFDDKFIDAINCGGLYDCGSAICEIFNIANVSSAKIISFTHQKDCSPRSQCVNIGTAEFSIICYFIAISTAFSILLMFPDCMYAYIVVVMSQISARTLLIIVGSFGIGELCWGYELATHISFSVYLAADLIVYCLYIHDLFHEKKIENH